MSSESGIGIEREVVASCVVWGSCTWGSSIALTGLEEVDLDVAVVVGLEFTASLVLPAAEEDNAGLLDHTMNRSSADNEEIMTAAAAAGGTWEKVDAIKKKI